MTMTTKQASAAVKLVKTQAVGKDRFVSGCGKASVAECCDPAVECRQKKIDRNLQSSD